MSLPEIRLKHVLRFLEVHGIDANGLDKVDRRYLKVLAACGDDGATLRTLAMSLNIDAGYLFKTVEPQLVRLGFIEIGAQRRITKTGQAYLEASHVSNF